MHIICLVLLTGVSTLHHQYFCFCSIGGIYIVCSPYYFEYKFTPSALKGQSEYLLKKKNLAIFDNFNVHSNNGDYLLDF